MSNSPFGPMQSPVDIKPYLGMEIFPLGCIITEADVSVDDWDIMQALASEAGLHIKKILCGHIKTGYWIWTFKGRVLINYEGHLYKTSCRYGRLRFKRMT